MKIFTIYSILLISSIVLFLSCSEEIDYKIPVVESQVVVEGWIENGDYPYVLLTKSSPYFSKVDSQSIRDLVVTRAKVTISDGVTTEVLTLKQNKDFFPPYVYRGTRIRGVAGKTYYLTVTFSGDTITASTTIPQPRQFDKIWFERESGEDSLGFIGLTFTDDGSTQNYYRLLTKRVNKDNRFLPTNISTYGDRDINGQSFTVFLYRKYDSFSAEKDSMMYYKVGDTVLVKFCSIDKTTFDIWRSLESEEINMGNPFASPNSRVKTNVKNGLGIWAGYGVEKYRVIAK